MAAAVFAGVLSATNGEQVPDELSGMDVAVELDGRPWMSLLLAYRRMSGIRMP
jgi:hypothetical protein